VAERGGPKRKLSTTARIFEGRLSAAVLVVVVVVVVVAVVAVVTDIASNVGKAHTLRRLRIDIVRIKNQGFKSKVGFKVAEQQRLADEIEFMNGLFPPNNMYKKERLLTECRLERNWRTKLLLWLRLRAETNMATTAAIESIARESRRKREKRKRNRPTNQNTPFWIYSKRFAFS